MEGWDLYGGEERDGKKAFERSIALAARLVGRTSRACSHESMCPCMTPRISSPVRDRLSAHDCSPPAGVRLSWNVWPSSRLEATRIVVQPGAM